MGFAEPGDLPAGGGGGELEGGEAGAVRGAAGGSQPGKATAA